jgi:hypothetical protein
MTIQLIFEYKEANPQALRNVEGQIRGISTQLEKLGSQGKQFDISDFMGGDMGNMTEQVKAQIVELQKWEQQLRKAAVSAQSMGKTVAAQDFLSRADDIKNYSSSLDRMIDKQKDAGRITSILKSKFNQLGFSLFVTRSTIRQITNALSEMFSVAQEGAAVSDRMQAFDTILTDSGVNAKKFAGDMREAADGAIALSDASVGVLRLLKSGLPEAAAESDKLLEIAVASATLSGELDQVDVIYNKLIRGIVRGSPRLIDDADILLKLGDANERYAATLGKTADELTINEQKMATLNAVMEEGGRILELAEDFDSAALTLQRFKVDAQEAGDVFKSAFGEGVAGAIDGINGGLTTLAAGIADLAGLTDEQAKRFTEMMGTTRGWMTGLIAIVLSIAEGFQAIGVTISETNKTIQRSYAVLGEVAALAWAQMRGDDEGVAAAKERLSTLFEDTLDGMVRIMDEASDITPRLNQVFEDMGYGLNGVEEDANSAAESIKDLGQELQDALGADLGAIESKISSMFDPLSNANINRDLAEKRLDIQSDFADKMGKIEGDLAEKISDINRGLQDKLTDLAKERAKKLVEIQDGLNDEMSDINEELAEKLRDIQTDSSESREKAVSSSAKKRESIERDHQNKIADIMSQFEKSRLKALIDRDARALFEAQQTRDSDLKSAKNSAAQKKTDEKKALDERLKEIEVNEKKKTSTEIKEAEKRRMEAKKDAANRLSDLRRSHEEQRREAMADAMRKRQDAMRDAVQARQDAMRHYQEQLLDLRKWHHDRLQEQKKAAIQRQLQMLKDLQQEGKLNEDYLNNLRRMVKDFEAGESVSFGDLRLPSSLGGGGFDTRGMGSGGYNGGGSTPRTTHNDRRKPTVGVIPWGSLNQRTPTQVNVELSPSGDNQMLTEILKNVTFDAVAEVFEE